MAGRLPRSYNGCLWLYEIGIDVFRGSARLEQQHHRRFTYRGFSTLSSLRNSAASASKACLDVLGRK
jgi:hypothetical protein